jgi:hypothetical protein
MEAKKRQFHWKNNEMKSVGVQSGNERIRDTEDRKLLMKKDNEHQSWNIIGYCSSVRRLPGE